MPLHIKRLLLQSVLHYDIMQTVNHAPLFNISLPDGVRSAWVGINILSVIVGLILSILCVKNRNSRSIINIVSTIISGFWVLLIGGIAALVLFLNFAS